MKRKILAIVALTSLIGVATASEKAPVLKGDVPIVAKCMEMHQFAALAFNSADPRVEEDYQKFMRENFDDEQLWAYKNQITEWNNDPGIKKAYNELRGPDYVGWSLTPALQLAACIKAL